MPESVVVPEGDVSVTFPVSSRISDQDEKVTIQASLTEASQVTTMLLRGARPSLTCAPRSVPAGQHARCELAFGSVPATDVVNLTLSSDSDNLKVPLSVTTRPGQSSLSFEIVADQAAKHQTANITASFGTGTAREEVVLLPLSAPVLKVPTKQLAKFGEMIRFTVAVSDANSPVLLIASDLPPGASWDNSTGEFVWTPDHSQAGRHEVVFTATNAANISSTGRVSIEVGAGGPVISALVNAATGSQAAACSPGSVARLLGNWLSGAGAAADPSGNSVSLAGASVRVNGVIVPLLYADPMRVDFLCPRLDGGTPLEAVIETETGSDTTRAVMQTVSPGIFSLDGSGKGQGLVAFRGTTAIAAVRDFRNAGQPAQPGDRLVIHATGLKSSKDMTGSKPLVSLGGMILEAEGVEAIAGSAGMFEIRVQVPPGIPTGSDVPVAIQLPDREGAISNTVSIAVEPVRF